MGEFNITILCPDCGSRDFDLPDEFFPDSVVTCNNCGRELIYGEVLESTKKKIFQALQNYFGEELVEKGIKSLSEKIASIEYK